MFVSLFVCLCVRLFACLLVCMCVLMCLCVCLSVCVSVCLCVCFFIFLLFSFFVFVFVSVYVKASTMSQDQVHSQLLSTRDWGSGRKPHSSHGAIRQAPWSKRVQLLCASDCTTKTTALKQIATVGPPWKIFQRL